MKMLDTNICIHIIKRKPKDVLDRFECESADGLCISAITLAELEFGVEKSLQKERNQLALAMLLPMIDVLPFDDLAAVEYGKIFAHLQRNGTPVGKMDILIAAHARSLGMPIVTNNTKDFEHVPSLVLENWVK